jgi:hypothetical protein
MADIKITFTYNLTDDYLSQTNNLNKSAEWIYEGPEKIWIFVNNETGKCDEFNPLTEQDNGETYPDMEGYTKVLIDCREDPLLGILFRTNTNLVDTSILPQTEIGLPNGTVYKRPTTPDPLHTYETSEITYLNGEWTIPWKKPWISWELIYEIRDEYLERALTEQRLLPTLPDNLKTKLQEFIASLQNTETEWEGYEPYMHVFPDYPL